MTSDVSSKQQSEQFKCEPCDDDFTLVVNNELSCLEPNGLSDAIVPYGRKYLLRQIQLERTIFCLLFYLIETYYRPLYSESQQLRSKRSVVSNNNNNNNNNNNGIDHVPQQADQKGMLDNDGAHGKSHQWHATYPMPTKRIYGLAKAYKNEYAEKYHTVIRSSCSLDDLLKFHHDSVDWQLVFAPVSGYPTANQTNLAKQLNYDSLFDIEDVITYSAFLLVVARPQYELTHLLTLNGQNNVSMRDLNQFDKLSSLIEQLIERKKKQLRQYKMLLEQYNASNKTSLINWLSFQKRHSNNLCDNKPNIDLQLMHHKHQLNIEKEVSCWEEFLDLINISS